MKKKLLLICFILWVSHLSESNLFACNELDPTNPSTPISIIEQGPSGLQCKKTTLGELPSWLKTKVAPNLKEKGILASVFKALNIFHKKKKVVYCPPNGAAPLNSTAAEQLGRNTEFSKKVSLLLTDNAYQYVDPEKLWEEYDQEIAAAKIVKEDYERRKKERGRKIKDMGLHALNAATTAISVLSPTSDDSKIVNGATKLLGEGIERVFTRKVDHLNFRSLIPENSYQVQLVKQLHGFSMVLIGALGLALAPVTAGLSTTILRPIGGAIAIAAAAAGFDFWFGGRDRNIIMTGDKTSQSFPGVGKYINFGSKMLIDAAHEVIDIDNLHFLPFSLNAISFMPYVGGAAQIAIGVQAMVSDYEKGHEFLKAYEEVFKKIFVNKMESRKEKFQSLFKMADKIVSPKNQGLDFHKMNLLSCTCDAYAWLNVTEQDGINRFDKRIKYLNEKLAWKVSRWNPSNWFTSKENLKKYVKEMEVYKKSILEENVALTETLSTLESGEPGSTERWIKLKLPKELADMSPKEIKMLEQKRRALDLEIASVVSDTQSKARKYLQKAAERPEQIIQIEAADPSIGNPPRDEVPMAPPMTQIPQAPPLRRSLMSSSYDDTSSDLLFYSDPDAPQDDPSRLGREVREIDRMEIQTY